MKNIVLVIVAVIILAGGAFALTRNSNNDGESTTDTETTQTSNNSDEQSTESTQQPSDTGAQSQANSVEIEGMAFSPSSITVKKGTTVTWTNRDSVQHDVTPDEESDAFQGSQLLAKDASYSFTFNTPGTYTYHCSPHPQMTATVVVTE